MDDRRDRDAFDAQVRKRSFEDIKHPIDMQEALERTGVPARGQITNRRVHADFSSSTAEPTARKTCGVAVISKATPGPPCKPVGETTFVFWSMYWTMLIGSSLMLFGKSEADHYTGFAVIVVGMAALKIYGGAIAKSWVGHLLATMHLRILSATWECPQVTLNFRWLARLTAQTPIWHIADLLAIQDHKGVLDFKAIPWSSRVLLVWGEERAALVTPDGVLAFDLEDHESELADVLRQILKSPAHLAML